MKYYETTYNEYTRASNHLNLHPELVEIFEKMPDSLNSFGNLIFYGPTGSGKYTQFLRFIEKYSTNHLKPDKMTSETEKTTYTYHISDVHYEVDLGQLGCESKKIWNECFFQIIDVVSSSPSKSGIILCRNFHAIHGELLEVFYSYMQHCRTLSIHIAFVLLTEHVSFIPNCILQCCKVISVKRPEWSFYHELFKSATSSIGTDKSHGAFTRRISLNGRAANPLEAMVKKKTVANTQVLERLTPDSILNLKEIHTVSLVQTISQLPKDTFNVICDSIINEMINPNLKLTDLRDQLYDILLYGLDITECLWYILYYFVENGQLSRDTNTTQIMNKIYVFLKCYNNNYRPIYHLESIFIYLIVQIFRYQEPTNGVRTNEYKIGV